MYYERKRDGISTLLRNILEGCGERQYLLKVKQNLIIGVTEALWQLFALSYIKVYIQQVECNIHAL